MTSVWAASAESGGAVHPCDRLSLMSAWSPLRYRVYRALWIALLVSNIGTWMQAVGAAWLMVELDASPVVVALVQTATYLPVVVLGVVAGAAADLVRAAPAPARDAD